MLASCTAPLPSFDLLDRAVEIERDDVVVEDLGAEALGLLLHLGHEVGALDAVGEAREVLDVGRRHEVAAGFDRARDDERLEVRARGVDRRRVARRTRSDDDDVTHWRPSSWFPTCLNKW